jgi:acyl carrier protein
MANTKTVEERVKAIIVDKLGVPIEKLIPQAHIVDDLGADSLDLVEIMMALEEEFDLEMTDEEAERLLTISDMIEYAEDRVKAANSYC